MHFRHHGPDRVEHLPHNFTHVAPDHHHDTTSGPNQGLAYFSADSGLHVSPVYWGRARPIFGSTGRLYDKKAGGVRSSHLGIRTRATRSTMLLIVHQRRICSNTTTSGSGIQRFEQEILFSCTFMKTLYNSCYMQKRISTNLQALHLLSLSGKGFCD